MKFNELQNINELTSYVESTYSKHYASAMVFKVWI